MLSQNVAGDMRAEYQRWALIWGEEIHGGDFRVMDDLSMTMSSKNAKSGMVLEEEWLPGRGWSLT
jgi:hypothetical protein